ncbi:dihydroorotate dehydrogenase [Clostridium acetobutylicum]|nr:dihydroorotate dehydrogenase [Clostridium acetobutylicum]
MTKVNICGIDFKNPVIAASGTFGFGEEFSKYFDVSRLGGISSKGLTLNPKEGNDGARVFEVTGGMMNSVGLQNPGVKEFIKKRTS